MTSRKNEGEGDHTAAKEYNDAQQPFVQGGKVDSAAKDVAPPSWPGQAGP